MGLLNCLPFQFADKTAWPWTEETNSSVYDKRKSYPKITIITPSFNQGEFIEETIRSILLQNYPNLEYIIVDGGSTDNTVDIIKQYEPWITYWVSEKDGGQSQAINKALIKSTGDIYNWINSDDLLLPGVLFEVAAYFNSLPHSTGVIHGGVEVFKDDVLISTQFLYAIPSVESYLSDLIFSQPSAFIRSSYLHKTGQLNEALHYAMDYELFAQLACVCNFKAVNNLFAKYRLHTTSKTIASGDKFRMERISVFFSLCLFLGWNDVIEEIYHFAPELRSTPVLSTNYSFIPQKEILKNVNKRKIIFYFLINLLKYYYWFDKRPNARILLKKIKPEFSPEWFAEDQQARGVIRRLAIPETALLLLKKIKSFVQHN